jgi:hypothetical protein
MVLLYAIFQISFLEIYFILTSFHLEFGSSNSKRHTSVSLNMRKMEEICLRQIEIIPKIIIKKNLVLLFAGLIHVIERDHHFLLYEEISLV